MARTPLLRALRRLAREHDAAERLGITPAELRRRRMLGLSRRDFLKGAAGVAAIGALAPTLRFAPSLALPSPRIAIVGAGISGLTAALTLKDKGIDATVYEASSSVGGRMHSDRSGYWADGQVSEFCGELIDSGHTTILGLAVAFRPGRRRSPRRSAVGLDRHLLVSERPLHGRAGRRRFRPGARRGEEGSHCCRRYRPCGTNTSPRAMPSIT